MHSCPSSLKQAPDVRRADVFAPPSSGPPVEITVSGETKYVGMMCEIKDTVPVIEAMKQGVTYTVSAKYLLHVG